MQFSDLDLTKTYTSADYLKWNFDERLELIKGYIFKMSPPPAEFHQRIFGKDFLNFMLIWTKNHVLFMVLLLMYVWLEKHLMINKSQP